MDHNCGFTTRATKNYFVFLNYNGLSGTEALMKHLLNIKKEINYNVHVLLPCLKWCQ